MTKTAAVGAEEAMPPERKRIGGATADKPLLRLRCQHRHRKYKVTKLKAKKKEVNDRLVQLNRQVWLIKVMIRAVHQSNDD